LAGPQTFPVPQTVPVPRLTSIDLIAQMHGWKDHLVGFDRNQIVLRAMGQAFPGLSRETFAFRTDSMLAQLEAVRQGAGLGALQVEIARRYPELVRALPGRLLAKLGMWLVTHQDVRGGARIRAVFDALGDDLIAYSAGLGTLLDDASA
jgi:DNA-binding transcriptional LysR family regulator